MSELKAVHAFDVYEAYTKTGDDDAAQVYLKSEADKVIAEKDAEIAGLRAIAKEPSVPNRTCRKCGRAGSLMYMPIVKDGRTYWDLYNNKGIDYVFGIQCAHCGEVAFVTKQTHEYELRKQKYKRCLDKANYWLAVSYQCADDKHRQNAERHHRKWLELAEKFKDKEAK